MDKYICVLDDTDLIPELCGFNDCNLKTIEDRLGVPVFCRGNEVILESSDKDKQEIFCRVIARMEEYAQKGVTPDADMISTLFTEENPTSDCSINIPGSSRRVFHATGVR